VNPHLLGHLLQGNGAVELREALLARSRQVVAFQTAPAPSPASGCIPPRSDSLVAEHVAPETTEAVPTHSQGLGRFAQSQRPGEKSPGLCILGLIHAPSLPEAGPQINLEKKGVKTCEPHPFFLVIRPNSSAD